MVFYSILIFIMSLLVLTYTVYEIKKENEIITPLTIFLGLSIIDIFIPGFIYISSGISGIPPWVHLDYIDLLIGLLTFLIGLFLFIIGYKFATKISINKNRKITDYSYKLDVKRAYITLLLSGTIYFLKLYFDVSRAGSVSAFLNNKFYLRWSAKAVEYSSSIELLVAKLSSSMFWVFITTVGVLFYYRIENNKKLFWGIILPLIAWLYTITTFYRGTQIIFFIGLFILEMLRHKKMGQKPIGNIKNTIKKSKKKILVILVLGVFLFAAYGAIRSHYSFQAHNENLTLGEAAILEVQKNFKGSALIGLSSILNYYPENKDFFYGKTIKDMLLLPIPRSIYPSKPEWYGIDEITTGMNWPSSTQSAVSIQGELYANFGYIGLIFMIIFGMIFGIFYNSRNNERLIFLYAFSFLPLVFVTFWMSFTGLMNGIIRLPIIFFFLFFILKKVKVEK